MFITITKNLVRKISVMEHILSSIGKNDNLINGILVRANGMLQAANSLINMSFRLTTEELGLAPDLPLADFILPEMAYKFLKNLSVGTSVEVILVKDNLINIVVDSGKKKKNKVEFATQLPSEYIEISRVDTSAMQKLNSEWFKSAISKTAYAVSTNNKKPINTAVHLIAKGGKIVAYACDGFKAAVVSDLVDKAESDFTLSIPQEVIKVLNAVDFAETILVGFNKTHTKAAFAIDDSTVIQGSLHTGKILNYVEKYINKGNKIQFTADTTILSSVVKQICLFNTASTRTPMLLSIKKDEIVCSFANEKTRYSDSVEIESTNIEKETLMGVDPEILLSTLKNCVEGKTKFRFEQSLEPLEVYNGDLSAIVVPMRINKEG